MTDTIPRGSCIHCSRPVHSGKGDLALPSGRRAHRGCWRRANRLQRAAARREYVVVVVVIACVLAAVVALAYAGNGVPS